MPPLLLNSLARMRASRPARTRALLSMDWACSVEPAFRLMLPAAVTLPLKCWACAVCALTLPR